MSLRTAKPLGINWYSIGRPVTLSAWSCSL